MSRPAWVHPDDCRGECCRSPIGQTTDLHPSGRGERGYQPAYRRFKELRATLSYDEALAQLLREVGRGDLGRLHP